MAQVARISGPLLAANLVRTQANLAFETDLLYVGHLNDRIGIKTASPSAELNVAGQIYTPNIYNDRLTGGNLEVNTNGVRSIVGDIILNSPGIIHAETLHTENLKFDTNIISTRENNDDIVFDPNQSGKVHFLKNTKKF